MHRNIPFYRHLSLCDHHLSALNLAGNEPQPGETFDTLREKWKSKILHGRYFSSLHHSDADTTASVTYLRAGYLFAETEGSLHAIQDQVVPTRTYRKHVLREQVDDTRCRLCNRDEESVQHLISACPQLAPTAYLSRHNNAAKIMHLELASKWSLVSSKSQPYNYEPQAVKENTRAKLLWDVPIVTDRPIQHNRPDIILVEKSSNTVWIIDISIPLDDNLGKAYREKIAKYEDLCLEVKAMWRARTVRTLPIIISANGIVHRGLQRHLRELDLPEGLLLAMQKAVILGTTSIVRRALSP